jgi:tetratricopeptide (TPR) repeat protein
MANIRAGIAHDLERAPLQALRSLGALSYMWVTGGSVPEGMRLLRQALDACPEAPAVDRARALIALSLTSAHSGAPAPALEYADAALELLDDTDPTHSLPLVEAHLRRCNALADLNDVAALPSAAADFVRACDRHDAPDHLRATALWGAAIVHYQGGRLAEAARTLTRAHEISVRTGFISGAGITDLLLAWCLLADEASDRSTVRRALDLLVRAIAAFEQQPNFSDELGALLAGVFALATLGMHDVAARLHDAVAAHAERRGTDPRRYMSFAGPDLQRRMDSLVGPARPADAGAPMAWADMVHLFTTTVADLPTPV